MRMFLLTCLGGALGAGTRHLVNVAAQRGFGAEFPWGTLIVNIAGSFLMGVLIETIALRAQGGAELRAFLATGFLGGFTTFSAYSLDAVLLFERGETGLAVLYAAASVLGAILALICGLAVVRYAFT